MVGMSYEDFGKSSGKGGSRKQTKDIDFIFNGTDGELEKIIGSINPRWVQNAVRNNHLGLVSSNDGGDLVDITPVHKFSTEMNGLAKGWTLKEDAFSRDLVLNTLQYEPIENALVDATGKALDDIHSNEIAFNMPDKLDVMPR